MNNQWDVEMEPGAHNQRQEQGYIQDSELEWEEIFAFFVFVHQTLVTLETTNL